MNREYDPVFEDKLRDTLGTESQRVSDVLRYVETDEAGSILVELRSLDQLEFDLNNNLERRPGVLNPQETNAVIQDAFESFFQAVGRFLPDEEVARYYPQLDKAHPKDYNFKDSKARVVVLSNSDFRFLLDVYRPDEKEKRNIAGFARESINTEPGKNTGKVVYADIGERKIIVINELPSKINERLKEKFGKLPQAKKLTEEQLEVVKANIKSSIIHELLHTFSIGTEFPDWLKEGLIEWYAQQITHGYTHLDTAFESKAQQVAYPLRTQAVDQIMEVLHEAGFTYTDIDRAFIGKDRQQIEQISGFLTKTFGQNALDRLLSNRFKDAKDALNFVTSTFPLKGDN